VIDLLATTLTYVALGAAGWATVLAVVNRPVLPRRWYGLGLLGVLAALELGLLAQTVAGMVAMFNTDRQLDKLSFAGYLIGILVILPIAVAWALAERSRWGPGVVVIGSLAIPVMIVRLNQLWEPHV